MSVVSLETETGEILSGDVIQEFTEDEARRHIDKVRGSVTVTAELVIEAWERRAWKALGYRTWEDLLEAEFPDIGMNQSARQVLMVGLRNAGMSLRGIAKTTGASRNTVRGQVGQIDPPDTVGTDGKTYTRSESHSVTETITDGEPVAGEAGTGDGPAAGSGGPSPTSDFGEAALGDDAEREPSTVHSSPGSPVSDTATGATVSDSDQADGAGERAPSASLYEEPAATEDDPVTDTVNQLGRFVAILAGMDEPTAQTIYEQGIWEFALGFIADHPDELDLSDVAVAALRTRSIEFPRGMQ
jgi:hypothetical protein